MDTTGYGGATDEGLILMRKHSLDHAQVNGAGGVRNLVRLLEVRALSVRRVCATSTVVVLDECKRRLGA